MRSPFRPALAVAVLLTSSLAAPLGAGARDRKSVV